MHKVKLIVNEQVMWEGEVTDKVTPESIGQTLKMLMEYTTEFQGDKIKMLKGLQTLR